MMVCYSVPDLIFTLEKRLIFENSINQILIQQLTLHSDVFFHFNMHDARKFQSCIDFFFFFFITCTNRLVWYSCQGKQSASSEQVKESGEMNKNEGKKQSCSTYICQASQLIRCTLQIALMLSNQNVEQTPGKNPSQDKKQTNLFVFAAAASCVVSRVTDPSATKHVRTCWPVTILVLVCAVNRVRPSAGSVMRKQ